MLELSGEVGEVLESGGGNKYNAIQMVPKS